MLCMPILVQQPCKMLSVMAIPHPPHPTDLPSPLPLSVGKEAAEWLSLQGLNGGSEA